MLRKFLLSCIMLFSVMTMNAQKNSIQWGGRGGGGAGAKVESGGNPKVVKSAGCAGLLQITKICVRQCNIWLEQDKSKKRYTYADRLDPDKSKEMFILTQKHLNPKNDIEHAIRLWKGGPHYKKASTEGYYKKVMRVYNKAGN